jgi:tRNA (cytidine/uridine-2'-O-)-methyltransferase
VFHVILHRPEIPPNAGNVIRLCANTGCRLHLIEPLGFRVDSRELKRAGLDYHEMTVLTVHKSLEDCLAVLQQPRLVIIETVGERRHSDFHFAAGDALLFGSETSGLPAALLAEHAAVPRLRIPMIPGNRSLNLSNAVAVVVLEAWRQQDFPGSLA